MALSSPALPRTLCTFKSRRAAAVSRRLYLYATAGSRHYRHRFARLPPSSFEFPNESSPSPHPCSLPLNGATTCYLSIVTCRRSTRVDAKHLPARKLVSTARGGEGGGGGERIEGRGELHGRRYRRLVLRRLNTFSPACYIIYRFVSFFFFFFLFFSIFFFSSLLFSPSLRTATTVAIFARSPVCYIHTYAHTKRMLMRVSWNTRIGVTAQLIKTRARQRFSRDHLDRSFPPSDRISTLPPITFPAPPTIDDNNNNSNNIIPTLARTLAESLGLAWKCRVRKIGRKTNCDFAGCV